VVNLASPHDDTVVVLTRHSRLLLWHLFIPVALLQFSSITYFICWSIYQIVRLIRAFLARPKIEAPGFPLYPPDPDETPPDV
jgi:hypothetical protein